MFIEAEDAAIDRGRLLFRLDLFASFLKICIFQFPISDPLWSGKEVGHADEMVAFFCPGIAYASP